jgi:tetratricopeptide (TPR) repeat protein
MPSVLPRVFRRSPRKVAAPAGVLALVVALLQPAPAGALTAQDARTESFKLQAEGMKLYRDGKYPQAIEVLQKVTNIHLNSFLAWYYLGAALSAERRYADAIEPLKIALDLQPDHMQAHLALGDALLKLGQVDESRAAYLRALDLQPNFAPAHDGLGRLQESMGHDAEAEAEYRKALEINVAFADAYTHLGELFLRQNRLDEATDLFGKAIAMKPDFSEAYVRLGVALSRLGRFDDAIAAARKSASLAPRDPEPILALAKIDLEMGSFHRSHAGVDDAMAIDPEFAYAHVMLADLARAEGDIPKAVAILEKRLERPIDDPRWKRAVNDRLKQARADAKTLASLEAAAVQAENAPLFDPAAATALARFWSGQRDHLKAASLLQDAAARVPAGPEAADPLRFEAGLEQLAARRFAEAITSFEALAFAPDGPLRDEARFNLGVAQAGAGLDEDAAATFRDCAAKNEADPAARLYLGNALLRLGRPAEAREAYSAYLARAQKGREADQVRRLVQTITGPQPAGPAAGAPPAAAQPGSR